MRRKGKKEQERGGKGPIYIKRREWLLFPDCVVVASFFGFFGFFLLFLLFHYFFILLATYKAQVL